MRNGLFPLLCAVCLGLLFLPSPCRADEATFDLESAIQFALKHNPSLRISEKDVATEKYGIDAAKAERMPKVDFGSGVTRYRLSHAAHAPRPALSPHPGCAASAGSARFRQDHL